MLEQELEEAGAFVEFADLVQRARDVSVVAVPDDRSLVGVGRNEWIGR